ncbi:MAG: cell division ATP-binding protein FtsE [Armatimonadetes bacterium]|nr:cell division ATP-binding protein FtsE [Armatimonadota bacterium]
MIYLNRVSVQFSPGLQALTDLTLKIHAREFVFVVGPTGAGKSTFLKLLLAEHRPTSGSIRIDDWDLTDLPARQIPELRRHIGVVFQDYQLLPDRSVFENVAFALHVTGAPRRRIPSRTTAVLEQVGLIDRMDAYPHELSGGEQQRVCIARALVTEPFLLIADEPTGNLDPTTSWEIMRLLEDANERGATVLVATHDRAIVDRFRRRVLTFDGGKLVRDAEHAGYFDPNAPTFLEPVATGLPQELQRPEPRHADLQRPPLLRKEGNHVG